MNTSKKSKKLEKFLWNSIQKIEEENENIADEEVQDWVDWAIGYRIAIRDVLFFLKYNEEEQ